MTRVVSLAWALALLGCGGAMDGGAMDGGAMDGGAMDGGAMDGGAMAPLVGEAFSCGKVAATGGIAASTRATSMEQKSLDTAQFPDALCNDGSPAIFYVRPAATEAARNKWVIQLMGGGGCSSMELCAKRWCNVDTNFSETQMTSTTSPDRTDGNGIFARSTDGPLPSPNPLADYNQVLLKYCSSDIWRGNARDVEAEVPHPITGVPTRYRVHFLGRRIFEATLATLRQDGVAATVYSPTATALPDLDAAEEVVLAGASAGGGGTTFNLDWLRASLRETNPAVEVLGLIDSTFGPDLMALDFTQSTGCTEHGLCDVATYLGYGRAAQIGLWQGSSDESCEASHATSGDDWKCASDTHVILNHLTTPFFVRQGLSDSLISDAYVDGGLRDAAGQPFTIGMFGREVAKQLESFPQLTTTAEEAASLTKTPGGYGPLCDKHETLRSTSDALAVSITPPSGTAVHMFDAWTAWRAGTAGAIVVSKSSNDVICQ